MNKSSFESFKAADMYAFGLVVWEVARRTLTTEKVQLIVCLLFVYLFVCLFVIWEVAKRRI